MSDSLKGQTRAVDASFVVIGEEAETGDKEEAPVIIKVCEKVKGEKEKASNTTNNKTSDSQTQDKETQQTESLCKQVVTDREKNISFEHQTVNKDNNEQIVAENDNEQKDDSDNVAIDFAKYADTTKGSQTRQSKSQATVTFSTLEVNSISDDHNSQGVTKSLRHCDEQSSFFLRKHVSTRVRYFIVVLALFSPFIVTYQKTIITNAIIKMDRTGHGVDGFWKGVVKGSYQLGHIAFQVFGGRISEMYGSYWIMASGSILMGLSCLLVPLATLTHYLLLIIDLMMLGMFGSVMTPALMTLFSNWLTSNEKFIFFSLYLIATRLGAAASSYVNDLLSWKNCFYFGGSLSLGYSLLFFLVVTSRPITHKLVSKQELDYLAKRNNLVKESIEERDDKIRHSTELKDIHTNSQQDNINANQAGIDKSNGGKIKATPWSAKTIIAEVSFKSKKAAPWLAILKSKTVWAFITAKVCVKFVGDTLQNELPEYINNIMHMERFGKAMAKNYFIFCIGCLVSGEMARHIIKRKLFGLSKTNIRKIFQCSASFGVSICFIIIILSGGDPEVVIYVIYFVTTLSTAGEAQIVFDISTRYSGTLHAMGSSTASLISVIQPILFNSFMPKEMRKSFKPWAVVWTIMATISTLGGVVFLLFADATIQDFDSIVVDGEPKVTEKKDDKYEVENGTKVEIEEAKVEEKPKAQEEAKVEEETKVHEEAKVQEELEVESGRKVQEDEVDSKHVENGPI